MPLEDEHAMPANFAKISVQSLFELHQNQATLQVIDVRETQEYQEVRAHIGSNIPLSLLHQGLGKEQLPPSLDLPVYIICRSGMRSLAACEILQQLGYKNLVNVTGGMLAWQAEALPLGK